MPAVPAVHDGGRNLGGRPPRSSRQAIVDAGLEILRTEGLDAVTLTAIGERLGLHKTALYTYVTNKDDLLLAMRDEVNRLVLAELREASDSAPDVALKAMCTRLAATMTDYGQLMISVEPDLTGLGLHASEQFLDNLARLGLTPDQQWRVYVLLSSSVTSIVAGTMPAARKRLSDANAQFTQSLAHHEPDAFPRLHALFDGMPESSKTPAETIEAVVSLVVDVLIPALRASAGNG